MIRNISLKVCERSGRTLVLLRTPPASFPKASGFSDGIADIHGFHQRAPIYSYSLGENQAWYDR